MNGYGNGNPFAFLLNVNPIYYYLLLTVISFAGISAIIGATIGIRALIGKCKKASLEDIENLSFFKRVLRFILNVFAPLL